MSYTIGEYYINGSNPQLENELLVIWAKFCLKSCPLPIFGGRKTVSQKFSIAYKYFVDNFSGNLCFYVPNEAFVVFGDGQKWLDEPVPELNSKRVSTLIMAASLNSSQKESWERICSIQECFLRLKNKGYDTVAWNINREYKRGAFLRMIKRFDAKEADNCQFVEL